MQTTIAGTGDLKYPYGALSLVRVLSARPWGATCLIAIVAFALGAVLACGVSHRAEPQGIPLEPILGALDAPARGTTLRQTGIVGGWAIAESGVKRIAIYVDRQFITFAVIDGKRPDIAKRYGKDFSRAEMSGWTMSLDVSQIADGDHNIVAQVDTNRGGIREIGPVPFKVAH